MVATKHVIHIIYIYISQKQNKIIAVILGSLVKMWYGCTYAEVSKICGTSLSVKLRAIR